MLCSPAALINLKDYELPPVPRSADKKEQDMLFRAWVVDAVAKYPELINSYKLLRGCWDHYSAPK